MYMMGQHGKPVGKLKTINNMEQTEWVDINGFEGYYQLDNLGNVKSLRTGKLLSVCSKRAYLSVVLYIDGVRHYKAPHRLVAEHFVPNPENKPEVNHLDGDKQNNYYLNLAWATEIENQQHAINVLHFNNQQKTGSNENLLILDVNTGVFYYSAKEAANYNNRTQQNLLRTFKSGRASSYHLQKV